MFYTNKKDVIILKIEVCIFKIHTLSNTKKSQKFKYIHYIHIFKNTNNQILNICKIYLIQFI